MTADHIHNIYREIISSCLSLETNLTVSFLGPEGTYSEIATNKFLEKVSPKIVKIIFMMFLMMLKMSLVTLVSFQ